MYQKGKQLLPVLVLLALLAAAVLPVSAAEDPAAIQPGLAQAVTLEPGQTIRYSFTPEKDGDYVFYQEGSTLSLALSPDGSYEASSWLFDDLSGYTYTLKGGVSYTLQVSLAEWHAQTHTTNIFFDEARPAGSLSLDHTVVSGYAGDGYSLTLTIEPEYAGKDVVWSSSDESVVKITHGGFTVCDLELLAAGEATVTASVGELSVSCTVTVKAPEVWMAGQSKTVTLKPGERQLYRFTPEESGTFVLYHGEKVLEFSLTGLSGDSVPQQYWETGGLHGYRYTLQQGVEYQILVEMWEGHADSQYAEGFTDTICLEAARQPETITLDQTQVLGYVDHSQSLLAVTVPVYGVTEGITWTTSDPDVVRIVYSNADYCEIYLAAVGTASVTATTENGLSASCEITVEDAPTLEENKATHVQVSGGRNVHCHFIPAVSGFYQFRIDTDAEIYAEIVGQEQTWSRVLTPEDNGMISVYLHGGKTAWIDVYSTAGASVSVTVVPSGHDLTWVEPKEATFEAAGNIGYYVCGECGGFFADADAAEEFMDHASVVIPQLQPPVEEIPNTGDASVVIPVAVLMILSGAGLVLTLIMMKQTKED